MSTSNTTVTVSATPGTTVTTEENKSFLSGLYDSVSSTVQNAVDTTVNSARTVATDVGVINKPATSESSVSTTTTTTNTPVAGPFTNNASGSASGIF